MKRPISNLLTIVLVPAAVIVLSTVLLFATGVQGTNAVKTTTPTTTKGATIQLTAKEVSDGVYRWIDTANGAANPKLKVFENANNIIKIQNPTDTKHQLIIDTGADELPASGVVAANGNGQLSFNPNMLGTFTYHCAFHPFMMQGTIQIVKS